MLQFIFTKTERYPGLEVEHNQFQRNVQTLIVNFKYRGFWRTILGVLAIICAKVGLPVLEEYRFFKQNRRESGLDTDGIVELDELDIPDGMRSSASRYEAASDFEFRHVLEKLHIDYPAYNFIDYGSGKGAIHAAAARYPFKSVSGVELSGEMHQIALRNIETVKQQDRVRAASLTSVHGDATSYALPPCPHVIYVFNAFGADVLQAVLDGISADLADVREPIYFLYNNPMHHKLLDMNPDYTKLWNAFGGKWMVFAKMK